MGLAKYGKWPSCRPDYKVWHKIWWAARALSKNILQSTPFRSKICTILLFAFSQVKNPHPSISSSLHHFSPHHITPNLHQFPNMHQPGWCCVNEILSKISYLTVWIAVRVLTSAPLGYFYNAPHWGGGLFRAPPPPLISETTGPILKIQAAFESPGKTVEGKQILLTSGSRVTSQVRSKSKCSTFRAWWHRRAKLRS